jgi:GGDEF domain-containing protein
MTSFSLPASLPRCGGWAVTARPDPITGLVAFPDFHAVFPMHFADAVSSGVPVGVAIGDVDHLKGYVEDSNATDPESFGHLAGNAFMARLGTISAVWFREQPFPAGCVSTFGGDEVIIAAAAETPAAFEAAIAALRDRCCQRLPRTVSFALTVVTTDVPGLRECLVDPPAAAKIVLAGVDRALFGRKAARRRGADDGFVAAVPVDLRTDDHALA